MKTSAALLPLAAVLAGAVDMASYQPAAGVEVGFGDFLKEFYTTMENKSATDTFTDFWPADDLGDFFYQGHPFPGSNNILGIKQALLPQRGDMVLWDLVRNASVVSDSVGEKTYQVEIVIQTSYPTGNCSQAYGDATFTMLKDQHGFPKLIPHSGSLSQYNLTVSTTGSPTCILN
ncbi:hypothetical protein CGRA01v4_10678 [Colletotrichum graminicola]|uniref:SnoaL-like domain-containing protein n=1 Tax=Colletotrichum graminicola (strain M1.001 / M2 / FGSC 10212) TaxID=645133 RepID=E3QZN5_COLGM|nr:uncharacterized protein GLRG_11468 [Colletotrichum graminicola M1.001]EFQ36323.1 hypothetical protein GLRG_11468 [Colletotrichum graminicola M1.001]WDK19391.1 hypothetical protein CGRA01v4_10678 [Colletotrichum graminicola]